MCGIAGFCSPKTEKSDQIVNRMLSVMEHRGPDSNGFKLHSYQDKEVALLHTRLSILDLSELGNQPYVSDDNNVILVFNGELYNYPLLKNELINKGYKFKSKCDTEALLYSYIEWGIEVTDHIKGDYAFCIYDRLINKLFLFRDPMGIKPLYYYMSETSFVFSSEIKTILEFPGIKRRVNTDLLSEYLINGWIQEPDTMFKDIYKLESGYLIEYNIDTHELATRKFFDITKNVDSSNNIDEMIENAVQDQTLSDAPLGLYLSGGLDSSIIAAKLKKDSVFTLTASMSKKELSFEGYEDDLMYAQIVAQSYPKLNMQVVELDQTLIDMYKSLIYSVEEPIADPAIVPAFILAKKARENGYKVMLSGMGADEIFGGYPRYLAFLKLQKIKVIGKIAPLIKIIANIGGNITKNYKGKYRKLFRDLNRFSNAIEKVFPLNYLYLKSYFSEEEILSLADSESLSRVYKKVMSIPVSSDYTDLQKAMLIDLKGFLSSHNTIYMDKCSMAASVECRVPLIDIDLTKKVFSQPDDFKIKNNVLKYGLKEIGKRYFDDNFINRKKVGFSLPVKSWISNELKDEILELKDGKLTQFLSRDSICTIIDQHYSNVSENSLKIWTLYTFELWLNAFFNDSDLVEG